MDRHLESGWLLLSLNLAAVYFASLMWVPTLPGPGSTPEVWLISPVAFLLLLWWVTNRLAGLLIWGAFMMLLTILSIAIPRSRAVLIAMPIMLFVLSLLQGLLTARIIDGIHAMGHS